MLNKIENPCDMFDPIIGCSYCPITSCHHSDNSCFDTPNNDDSNIEIDDEEEDALFEAYSAEEELHYYHLMRD